MIENNIVLLESGVLLNDFDNKVITIVENAIRKLVPKEIVVRIAGGWVRDKLFGLNSDDIDIAVDGISINEFAEVIRDVSEYKGAKVVVLQENHEQCKHLSTARVSIFPGFWLDICNLRPESFRESSMELGTPISDSHRRDLTINALFFNLNTKKIEDYVGGIHDLINGIIRTPIPAIEDFTDDPLRIIRAFRFQAKLGFEIDGSVIESGRVILPLLSEKIPADRIYQEVSKIFRANHFIKCVHSMRDSGLFSFLFCKGVEEDLIVNKMIESIELLEPRIIGEPLSNRELLCLSSMFHPLIQKPDINDPQKSGKISFIKFHLSRQLKYSLDIANEVELISRALYSFKDIPLERLPVGKFIRSSGKNWILCKYLINIPEDSKFFESILVPYIMEQNLECVLTMKPLLKGDELAKIKNIPIGKELKYHMELMFEWQVNNPAARAEDYKEFLRASLFQ